MEAEEHRRYIFEDFYSNIVFVAVSSPFLSMGLHHGGSGPITPAKPVPRPLGTSSLFPSPLHSLLYRHPYLAGGWTIDARGPAFSLLST